MNRNTTYRMCFTISWKKTVPGGPGNILNKTEWSIWKIYYLYPIVLSNDICISLGLGLNQSLIILHDQYWLSLLFRMKLEFFFSALKKHKTHLIMKISRYMLFWLNWLGWFMITKGQGLFFCLKHVKKRT